METIYYKTSDGNLFYTENSAANHAKILKDKSVTPVTFLPTAPQEIKVEVGFKNPLKENQDTKEKPQKPLNKMNKPELLAFANELGIEVPEDWNKAQITAAITEKQTPENK